MTKTERDLIQELVHALEDIKTNDPYVFGYDKLLAEGRSYLCFCEEMDNDQI